MTTSDNSPNEVAKTGGNWLERILRRSELISRMCERRRIRRVCMETLIHYRKIRAELPQVSNEEIYAKVIEKRIGSASSSAVPEIMRRAKESFATWPVDRSLTLRDITQYIVVTDCLINDIAVTGVRSGSVDLVLVIAREVIPDNL